METRKPLLDLKKYELAQQEIAKQLILTDQLPEDAITTVAGTDVIFHGNHAVALAVVLNYKTGAVIEKKVIETNIDFPYIPEFLAFRSGPPIVEAVRALTNRPDIVLVDGHGIAHERRCGLAVYVGIELDLPTIGIATSLAAGMVKEGKIFIHNEVCGHVFQSRIHSKPIYISPGHKVSLETSISIVKHLMKYPHKLPEPLHIAHRVASKSQVPEGKEE